MLLPLRDRGRLTACPLTGRCALGATAPGSPIQEHTPGPLYQLSTEASIRGTRQTYEPEVKIRAGLICMCHPINLTLDSSIPEHDRLIW